MVTIISYGHGWAPCTTSHHHHCHHPYRWSLFHLFGVGFEFYFSTHPFIKSCPLSLQLVLCCFSSISTRLFMILYALSELISDGIPWFFFYIYILKPLIGFLLHLYSSLVSPTCILIYVSYPHAVFFLFLCCPTLSPII